MKKSGLLALITMLFSSCSEVLNFGMASANLFFVLLKFAGILFLAVFVIGMIVSYLNRNK